MYLTAKFKLRTNARDRRLLGIALRRWSAAMGAAMDGARARRGELLRCIVMWHSKDGARSRLVVDKGRLHGIVATLCEGLPVGLHSSARMSLVVAVQEQIGSWLGLYVEWANAGRKTPKPSFPEMPPLTARLAVERYTHALEAAGSVTTLSEENRWRAEVMRAARDRRLPQYFGAVMSGAADKRGKIAQAHCGLLRREDGRYFALLTLWPQGEPEARPVTRARNRRERGDVTSVRSSVPFAPTEHALSSVMVPLELGRGHEHLFFGRSVPKSADLVEQADGFYLHVAFAFPEHAARASDAVLAVRRGVGTLLSVVVLRDRKVLARLAIDGKALAALVTGLRRLRAIRQQKGVSLAGDRRQARVVEHHLASACHQIIDLACRHGAEIVLLEDRSARKPQRFLAYKHFHRIAEMLGYMAPEAGLPAPRERAIYGSWKTCVVCGWAPGDVVRHTEIAADQCPGCAVARDPEYHLPHLLALDTLRLRNRKEEKAPSLGNFIKSQEAEP